MPSKPEILPYVHGSLKLEEVQRAGPAGMLQRGESQRRGSVRTVLRQGAEECPKESVLALLPFSIQSAGDAGFGSQGEVSLPLCCQRGSGWGVPARRWVQGDFGSRGTGAPPPGWLCLCGTRLLVTEPFSSACEMSVVTELRPTKKGPFTVRGGEVKNKPTYC